MTCIRAESVCGVQTKRLDSLGQKIDKLDPIRSTNYILCVF